MSNLTIPALKQKLETLLLADLGKFSNGRPAIWTGENYPTGTPTGLACFIQATVEPIKTQSVSGNQKAIIEHFVVFLVQFDRKKSTYTAMRKIQMEFPIASCDTVPATEKEFEQCIIRIINTGFIGRIVRQG